MTGLSLVAILLTFTLLYVSTFVFHRSLFLRLTIVTYLVLISSGIYFSFETYKGWPSKDKLVHGYLIYSVTIEPSKEEPGAIYFWALPEEEDLNIVKDFLTYKFELTAPRAYYLPYSKKAAEKFGEANEKLKQGFVVEIGGNEPQNESDQNGDGNDPQDGESGSSSGSGEQEKYDVPHLTIISPDEILRKGSK